MAIINFGSLNIDHTYTMSRFVQPGETVHSAAYNIYCGGKGLNQSVAASRAGAGVTHACMVGQGGKILVDHLNECGVDTSMLKYTATAQGHAIIQVAENGENSIILFSGSNYELSREYVCSVLDTFEDSCYVILQNETSNVPFIIEEAAKRGHKVVFNASPFEASLNEIDLKNIAWLMVNEIEGAQISGETEPENIIAAIHAVSPNTGIVLTLGKEGSICCCKGEIIRQGIFTVNTVDTTGAGDTFTGFFVAALDEGRSIKEALKRAAAASAIAVSRKGAAPSIPTAAEVDVFIEENDR